MSNSNQRMLLELQKKRHDQCTEFVAAQGLDFSDSLQQVSNVLLKQIEKVEDDLRKDGGSNDDFFVEQNKAEELQKSIKIYKATL